MSDGLKAIKYAEDELGVHKVYREAVEAQKGLQEVIGRLIIARDKKRDLEQALIDREMEIALEQRSIHPEMPVTRMEALLKTLRNDDDTCRELKEEIRHELALIDGFEFDKGLRESSIKIMTARMTELGGYLQYLAAIKLEVVNAGTKPAIT